MMAGHREVIHEKSLVHRLTPLPTSRVLDALEIMNARGRETVHRDETLAITNGTCVTASKRERGQ